MLSFSCPWDNNNNNNNDDDDDDNNNNNNNYVPQSCFEIKPYTQERNILYVHNFHDSSLILKYRVLLLHHVKLRILIIIFQNIQGR
jgi:hypothetical protein